MREQDLWAAGVSPALSAAYDVLSDAGLFTDQRLLLCRCAELQGRDPEAFARKLVRLCRAVQSETKVTQRCGRSATGGGSG